MIKAIVWDINFKEYYQISKKATFYKLSELKTSESPVSYSWKGNELASHNYNHWIVICKLIFKLLLGIGVEHSVISFDKMGNNRNTTSTRKYYFMLFLN
jgi:hypothetical protein